MQFKKVKAHSLTPYAPHITIPFISLLEELPSPHYQAHFNINESNKQQTHHAILQEHS